MPWVAQLEVVLRIRPKRPNYRFTVVPLRSHGGAPERRRLEECVWFEHLTFKVSVGLQVEFARTQLWKELESHGE